MSSPSATSADNRSLIARAEWRPDELGLGRAFLLASVIVALLLAGLAAMAGRLVATSPPLPVAVRLVETTTAGLAPFTQAEAATPDAATIAPSPATDPAPPLPEPVVPAVPGPVAPAVAEPVAPDAEPVPAPVADALPDLALEATPELAPPVAVPRQTVLPPPQPAVRPSRQRPVRPPPGPTSGRAGATEETLHLPAAEQAAASAMPSPAPTDTTSGLGPYRAALHRQIERNMLSEHDVQRLGVSGTALIEASLAPDGRVLLARIARSSGNRTIDQAALAAVRLGGFAAFGPHMPTEPIAISVPIGIEAE